SFTFNSVLYQEQSVASSQANITNLLYGTNYYWHAAARNEVDTSGWSATWSFTTAYELTEAPILVSPINSSTDLSYSDVDFTWDASTGAVNYQYQISLDNSFTAIIKSTTTSLVTGNITGLYPHTTYYWRVRGANANGYSPWSEIWNFTTESADLTAPVLISPLNNSTDIDTDNVILDWNSVYGASAYVYEITEDENFVSGITTQEISDTYKEIIGLAEGTQYFWRIKATDGVVYSEWSEVWNFTTETNELDAPILVSPTNNATEIDAESVVLDWNSVSGASQYVYEISTDNTFSTDVTTETINETQKTLTALSEGIQYFWRVKATDGVIESAWSEVWNFTTESTQQYTLIINVIGCGFVKVNDIEYTEPVVVDENTILSLSAEFPMDCTFTYWEGDLSGNNNPEQLIMNEDKNVTAVFDIVEVEDISINSERNIYPNPASDYFMINENDLVKLEIFNITGQLVYCSDKISVNEKINVKSFEQGAYLVKITSVDRVYTERLIIQ
ncbi:MAG TPA: T9SS type A sorting domain-containing protein, partial [Bacteroidales bacterium]|nr:T9SS type A sorting domain-containing protein [Bacteroidales bacterium]